MPSAQRHQYEQGLAGEAWVPGGYACREHYIAGLMRRSRIRRLIRTAGQIVVELSERGVK